MANTFIAINRGQEGIKFSDYVIGVASTASADFELRVAALDAQGKVPTRKDAIKAVKAFMRAVLNVKILTTPPF